jgi:two-component system sensor histidine kinase KdpD
MRIAGPSTLLKNLWRFCGRCTLGLWATGLVTLAGFVLHFSVSTIGYLYLLIVLTVAIAFGFWEATVASVVASACLNYYFIPPIFSFRVSDGQDVIALIAFESTALIVSRLSSREQRHALDAVLQRTSLEKLYELSRSTLLLDLHQPPSRQLAQLIYQIFNAAGVALFDADSGQSELVGSWSPEETNLARSVYLQDSGNDDHRTQTYERVLRLGATSIGSLVIRGECNSVTINALASLTEMAFERYRSFEKESRAESASQGEQLRTAVLDALAHAFKTPLTAIRTASSGLLEIAGLTPAQAGLVTLIDDESSMLNDLCTRLLQTAKLEAESLGIRKDEILVSEMVDEVVTECSHRDPSHKLQVSITDPNLAVRGDKDLITMILSEYLRNAEKYSNAGSLIEISARECRSEVVIGVHNYGNVIPLKDRDRVFERFYRLPDAKSKASGTGIGLSIVRKAAEAHRGHAWVISDEKDGTTFFVSLPIEPRRAS